MVCDYSGAWSELPNDHTINRYLYSCMSVIMYYTFYIITIGFFTCIFFRRLFKAYFFSSTTRSGKRQRGVVCIPATSTCPIKFTPIIFFNFANFHGYLFWPDVIISPTSYKQLFHIMRPMLYSMLLFMFVYFSKRNLAKSAHKMLVNWLLVSISSTFYMRLFCTKANQAAFSSYVSAL